jgi:NMD protein affecting ribosome stability and mRNA decay
MTIICATCGEPTARTYPSGGEQVCRACYVSNLAYGHLHVDHDAAVEDCPLCQQERKEDRIIGSTEGR